MLNFAPQGPSLITKKWRDGLVLHMWICGYEIDRDAEIFRISLFIYYAGRRSHCFTGSSWDKMKWNANLLREAITTRSPSWSPRRDSPSARDATLCANCGSDWTRPSHVILPLCVYNARRAWPMCALLPISQRNATKCKCQFPYLHKCPHNTKCKCKCETPVCTHTTPESPNSPLTYTILKPIEHEILCIVDEGICEIVRSRVTSQFMRCVANCDV